MKLFIDTANIEQIREMYECGVICGVTTNPAIIAQEGKAFIPTIKEICKIVDGPISAEVISLKSDEMIKEAMELVEIHKNIVVKVPILKEGMKAVSYLAKHGVNTNVTTIFSVNQAILAANAGATYVSPFVGKCDEYSIDGMDCVNKICSVFKIHNIQTKVIAASMRTARYVYESALAGADIATVPYSVLNSMFNHPLTDECIEIFLSKWNELMSKEQAKK